VSKLSVLMRVICSDAINLMDNIIVTGLLLLLLTGILTRICSAVGKFMISNYSLQTIHVI
jgi:hypothetical protein